MNILRSLGIKRQISAALQMVVGILLTVPGTAEIVVVIETIAALFGVTGLSHAAAVHTLDKKKLAGVTALLAIIIQICQFIPEMEPFIPFLQKLATILGSVSVGALVVAPKKTTSCE